MSSKHRELGEVKQPTRTDPGGSAVALVCRHQQSGSLSFVRLASRPQSRTFVTLAGSHGGLAGQCRVRQRVSRSVMEGSSWCPAQRAN